MNREEPTTQPSDSAERARSLHQEITGSIIGSAIDVHKALGPGLRETAYVSCLAYELRDRGHSVEEHKSLPVVYRDHRVDEGYQLDLVVDESVVVELKTVEQIEPIHEAQLLSYLKLSGYQVGLVMNFNARRMRDGIKRVVAER